MFILVLIPILFGEQDLDPTAKSIAINGKVYYKLKWKE